jgi:hypothetical protein
VVIEVAEFHNSYILGRKKGIMRRGERGVEEDGCLVL